MTTPRRRSLGATGTTATGTRRNIYVRAEDAALWDRAEQLAGESLSQLIADQLRRYVADRESEVQGLERIVLDAVVKGEVPPGPWEKGEVRRVAFYGRWLVGTEHAISDGDMHFYRVALTKQGKIAVLVRDMAWGHDLPDGRSAGDPPQLKVYDSLGAADHDGIPHFVLDLAATALGTQLIDELDI